MTIAARSLLTARFLDLPARDVREGGGGDPALGATPIWDFSGLYSEPADNAIEADLSWADAAAKDFAAAYEGKLASLSGDALAKRSRPTEAIGGRLGRVMSYVFLRYQQNVVDADRAKALSDAQTRATDIEAPIVFSRSN